MYENQEYVRRIMLAVNVIDGLYEIGAKESGVKANTLCLLYALDDGKPHTQKSICDEWLIPRTTINTIIKECVEGGYVTLESVPGQRRELLIRLTGEGRAFARSVLAPIYRAERDAIAETLRACDPDFIAELEAFSANLSAAFGKYHLGK